MFDIHQSMQPVKRYPYRTALVRQMLLTIPRTDETIQHIESAWAHRCGSETENHTTYKFESRNDPGCNEVTTFYITCSDSTYYVGLSVEERHW